MLIAKSPPRISFPRAFEWCKWLRVLNFVIFFVKNIFGLFLLGMRVQCSFLVLEIFASFFFSLIVKGKVDISPDSLQWLYASLDKKDPKNEKKSPKDIPDETWNNVLDKHMLFKVGHTGTSIQILDLKSFAKQRFFLRAVWTSFEKTLESVVEVTYISKYIFIVFIREILAWSISKKYRPPITA